MTIVMTDGGIQLDKDDARALRALLAAVVAMHPVEGDALGAAARRLQAALPAAYTPPPPPAYTEPLPRPADYAWWERKDKPEAE